MNCQQVQLLPDFVLGDLPLSERRTLEAHISGCVECQTELGAIEEAFSSLAEALPKTAPRPLLQTRLFREVEGPRRFDPFIDKISDLFSISSQSAEQHLQSLDRSEIWLPGPAEGILVAPVQPGPKWSGTLSAFVRLEPGVRFPKHRHVNGEEHVFLLQGAYRDESGEVVKRGQYVHLPMQHVHDLVALEGPICIGAVLHFGHDYQNI